MILIITVAVTLIITLVIILKIIVIIIKHKSICNNVLLSVDNKTVYYILYKNFFDFLTYTIYIDYSKKNMIINIDFYRKIKIQYTSVYSVSTFFV